MQVHPRGACVLHRDCCSLGPVQERRIGLPIWPGFRAKASSGAASSAAAAWPRSRSCISLWSLTCSMRFRIKTQAVCMRAASKSIVRGGWSVLAYMLLHDETVRSGKAVVDEGCQSLAHMVPHTWQQILLGACGDSLLNCIMALHGLSFLRV